MCPPPFWEEVASRRPDNGVLPLPARTPPLERQSLHQPAPSEKCDAKRRAKSLGHASRWSLIQDSGFGHLDTPPMHTLKYKPLSTEIAQTLVAIPSTLNNITLQTLRYAWCTQTQSKSQKPTPPRLGPWAGAWAISGSWHSPSASSQSTTALPSRAHETNPRDRALGSFFVRTSLFCFSWYSELRQTLRSRVTSPQNPVRLEATRKGRFVLPCH